MNVGFDLDDTITRCPEFFAVISRALVNAGHHVYIVTYREDREFAEEDLAEHRICYTELLLPDRQDLTQDDSADWKVRVGRWKARVCLEKQIELLFDDMPEVINALGPQTVPFMTVDRKLGRLAYERLA